MSDMKNSLKHHKKPNIPQPLGQFIELANLMSEEQDKWDFLWSIGDMEESLKIRDPFSELMAEVADASLGIYDYDFHSRFKKTGFYQEWRERPHIKGMYHLFFAVHDMLRRLATTNKSEATSSPIEIKPIYRWEVKPNGTGTIEIDKEHFLGVRYHTDALVTPGFQMEGTASSLFLKFLASLEGQSIYRIKNCPICDRIYWASRKDQPTCTIKHAKVLRTREWRKNKEAREIKLKNKLETELKQAVIPGIIKSLGSTEKRIEFLLDWNEEKGSLFAKYEIKEMYDLVHN